jgi:hypothetical protein
MCRRIALYTKLTDVHHKGEPWLSHVNRALSGDIKDLETRFYVGKLNGQIVANIMTVEYNRTGILGHVFTMPEQRRKGICSLIMEQQMADFKCRGGGVLILELVLILIPIGYITATVSEA